MPATIEVTIHDYQVGADKTVTITLSDDQIAEAVEKQKAKDQPEKKKTKE